MVLDLKGSSGQRERLRDEYKNLLRVLSVQTLTILGDFANRYRDVTKYGYIIQNEQITDANEVVLFFLLEMFSGHHVEATGLGRQVNRDSINKVTQARDLSFFERKHSDMKLMGQTNRTFINVNLSCCLMHLQHSFIRPQ